MDHHAARYLPLLVRGEEATKMQQPQGETLECRTDKDLAELKDKDDFEIRAPRSYRDRIHAATNMFSPVNRVGLLVRTLANLKQGCSETVDS